MTMMENEYQVVQLLAADWKEAYYSYSSQLLEVDCSCGLLDVARKIQAAKGKSDHALEAIQRHFKNKLTSRAIS